MRKRYFLFSILLVLIMFAAVTVTNKKELIFPEISALAIGAWVMEQSPWKSARANLWFSPSLAALTGFLIIKRFPNLPLPVLIAGAFILVVLQLELARSRVLPSVSAAILPIITHTDSWLYPLSVCVLTGTVAIGHLMFSQRQSVTVPHNSLNDLDNVNPNGLVYWGKVFVGLLIVSTIASGLNIPYIIAPPLIVMYIELSNPIGPLRQRIGPIFILLTYAAFSGALGLYIIYYVLHWPLWVSTSLTFMGLFPVFEGLKLPFPPAAAICLLPTLLPKNSLWSYPIEIMLGMVAFMVLNMLWFKPTNAVNS